MGKAIEEQFIAWYDSWSDAIFRHCYFRIYDYERARDLTQEVFTRVWQYAKAGNVIDNPRALLYKTATNCIINEHKKKSTESLDAMQEETGFDVGSTHDERNIFGMIDGKKLIEKIDSILDEKHKTVILLRYLSGLGPKEIAEATSESENVVSVRLHRAIKKLRTELGTYE